MKHGYSFNRYAEVFESYFSAERYSDPKCPGPASPKYEYNKKGATPVIGSVYETKELAIKALKEWLKEKIKEKQNSLDCFKQKLEAIEKGEGT